MEDAAGWIMIAITPGIAGVGRVALVPLAKTVVGTAVFLVLSYINALCDPKGGINVPCAFTLRPSELAEPYERQTATG